MCGEARGSAGLGMTDPAWVRHRRFPVWGLGEKMGSLSLLSSSVNTLQYSKNVYSQGPGDNGVKGSQPQRGCIKADFYCP